MKFINGSVFIISLAIGLFMCYITAPPPDIIVVYPTPENINQIQYKDRNETCYKFDSTLVKCPENSNEIHEIPAQ
tara:strand:+ start:320 stop:544 length:225 start_codon:yes stop_codon:yes gene_type:complete